MNDETKTKIAEKSKTEVLPMSFFEQDAQSGFDNMSSDDYALPFLRILGQLSPQCNKRDAKYVDCLLYTSPSPRDGLLSRMPSSA